MNLNLTFSNLKSKQQRKQSHNMVQLPYTNNNKTRQFVLKQPMALLRVPQQVLQLRKILYLYVNLHPIFETYTF